MIEMDLGDSRRIPYYFLIDCGVDMLGRSAEVEKLFSVIFNELMGSPQSVEMDHLSLITFSDKPKLIIPLKPITSFELPKLKIEEKKSDLNSAMEFVWKRILKECVEPSALKTGDYHPTVIILIDQSPSETVVSKYAAELELLGSAGLSKNNLLIFFWEGDQVDKEYDFNRYKLMDANKLTLENIKKCFNLFWVGVDANIENTGVLSGRELLEVARLSRNWMKTSHSQFLRSKTTYPKSKIIAGSICGKRHQEEKGFRDDAFGIVEKNGWIFAAIADGSDESKVPRVASNAAVQLAIMGVNTFLNGKPHYRVGNELFAYKILLSAISEVWGHIAGSTLLLFAYHPGNGWAGALQVGSGLIAVQLENGNIELLAEPKSGEYLGDFSEREDFPKLISRIQIKRFWRPRIFFVMTDGIANDLYPPVDRLQGLAKPMPEILSAAQPDQALLKMISYDRPNSEDDRTLVVIAPSIEKDSANPLPVL